MTTGIDTDKIREFNAEIVGTFDPVKTREQIREESGEQNIQQKITGVGYQSLGQNNQIG